MPACRMIDSCIKNYYRHTTMTLPFLFYFPAETNVLFYLNDAVTQLLEHKEEYTQFGVVRYFAE